ncbi:DMT family transporter [Streptomyces sp. NBS 14/10]|uniref:DMT family transporter n=1 Tax=Streptomyces sp. NBS 14/10 TaxID=1945643 RepID=UPI000B7DB7A0|nr:DMT family transporter [Streptomyces sp. NBS 14/10]KAK1183324.1 DMT family transporter [Streptomyces sp. NBS 14/10]
MRAQDSATASGTIAVSGGAEPRPAARPPLVRPRPAPSPVRRGGVLGTVMAALGVAAFSLTFPATAWGLEGLGPWSLVGCRLALAGLVAGGALAALRVPPPGRRHWPGLLVVAGGVVFGFPLLSTLALRTSTTSHAAVVVGLLPLTTAVYAAVRTGSRPTPRFWTAAVVGAAVIVVFALQQSGGAPTVGDLYLFGALLVCAAGYGEGARLAGHMPGWQVIGWALVACLPLSVAGAAVAMTTEPVHLTAHAVAGALWLALGSQFLGLVVWYRGMAAIGVARASQLQLAQPLLTLVWSVLLLGEHLTWAAPAAAVAVLVCIGVTQRASTGAKRVPEGAKRVPEGADPAGANPEERP